MRKIFVHIFSIILLISGLECFGQITIDSPQTELNHKYEVAKKRQKSGAILTFSGLTAIGVGYGLVQYGWYQKTPTSDTRSLWAGNIGALLFSAGIPVSCVGVIKFLVGSDQKATAKKNLEISLVNIKSPMISKSVNGISFRLNF